MRISGVGGRWAARILCALALLFVGFAHQPVIAYDAPAIDFAAYVLPDGTLPVFCITDTDTTQKDKHVHAQGCDACRITASILLPQPADSIGQALELAVNLSINAPVEIEPRRIFSRHASPRGPPEPVLI
jgi:hypothetical protein